MKYFLGEITFVIEIKSVLTFVVSGSILEGTIPLLHENWEVKSALTFVVSWSMLAGKKPLQCEDLRVLSNLWQEGQLWME